MTTSDCSANDGRDTSGFRTKVLRATFWSAVCLWGNRVFTLLFLAILARVLDPAAFGLVALSSVYIGFLTIFQEQGFGPSLIQRKDLNPDHLSTAFWMNLACSLVLLVITMLGAPLIGRLFHEPRLPMIVRGLSPLLVISGLTCVQRAMLHRQLAFRTLALATIMGVLVGGVAGTVAALNGFGVWSLVCHQVVMRACESGLIWWQSRWRPAFRWNRMCFLDLFGFGKYVVGSQLLSFVQVYAADMVIGLFLGLTAVGLFDVAHRCIRMILQMISGVVSRVSLPTFSRLQEQPEHGRVLFLKATKQITLVSFPAFAAMAALAPEIVGTIFGEKWASAAPPMRALCFMGMIQSTCYLKRSLILGYGRAKWHFSLEVTTLILMLIAVFLAVRMGIVAIAWAQVSVVFLSFLFLVFVAFRLVHLRATVYMRTISPALIASAAMALVIYVIRVAVAEYIGVIQILIVGLSIGGGVYFAAVWLIDPVSLTDTWQYVRALLTRTKCAEPNIGA